VAHDIWRALARCAGLVTLLIACGAHAEETPWATLNANGVVDTWRNLQGGLATGSAQLGEIETRLDLNGDRFVGWRGASASISVLGTTLRGPSRSLLGDLQTADNKEATRGTRLYEAWLRQGFGGGYAKLGVVDLNSEFNLSRTSSAFVNGAQGLGLDLGQVGANGPSVYPDPRLGLVAAAEGTVGVKLGVFDGLTQAGGPHRGDQPLGQHGALAILEFTHRAPGEIQLSAAVWRHGANFGSGLEPISTHPAGGGYLMLEAPLWRGPARAVLAMLRVGAADPKTEQIALHLSADLVVDRPFRGPEGEVLGFGILNAVNGAHARRLADQRGAVLRRAETTMELTYRRPLSSVLSVQPDIQYIIHPGAVAGRGDALVTGVRLAFAWSAAR
jgi:porin